MAIDILFLIMATFGFYFGYTFGLMRLALVLFSFLFATLAAMSFTPMTSGIIQETFGVDSVFLPFIAFGVTLLIVLMLARIVTKLIEETLTNERFDVLSRIVGGVLMALWFTLLYSVLVIFFGKAGVLKLVFNDQALMLPVDGTFKMSIPKKTLEVGGPDTLTLTLSREPEKAYNFRKDPDNPIGDVSINLGFVPIQNNAPRAYVNNQGWSRNILKNDTVRMRGTRQLLLKKDNKVICFCDSAFVAYTQGDTALLFRCTDENIAAKSATSRFYPYIAIIPRRGNQLMNGLRPLIKEFIEYMGVALDRVEQRPPPRTTIDPYDENETRPSMEPALEEDLPIATPQKMDTLGYPVDTSLVPSSIPDSVAAPLPEVDSSSTDVYEG